MKPFYHAKISAKRYGGTPADYIEIHDFFDSSKQCLPDVRHRALLHSSFGIYLLERVFGTTIKNSDEKEVCVRDIGEDHVMQDMGFIPTVEWWLQDLPIEPRMIGKQAKKLQKVD